MIETLGHYNLLERIGAGGIGEVYRARDTRLGRTVAVKIVRGGAFRDAAERERLLADARAAAALSHPNAAAFYEVGEERDVLYLVSEFVPGETLQAVIGGRPINPRRAVDLASQVADALAQAHAHGIAHGDVRSENVIVTPKGNAKVMEPAFASWVATDRSDGPPTEATGDDLFDLGVLLFEMLTGAVPERRDGPPVPAPSAVNRAITPELDAIVERLVSPDPAARFGSVAVAAAELRGLAARFDARPRAEPRPVVVARKRGSSVGWLLALLALAAVAALVWMAVQSG